MSYDQQLADALAENARLRSYAGALESAAGDVIRYPFGSIEQAHAVDRLEAVVKVAQGCIECGGAITKPGLCDRCYGGMVGVEVNELGAQSDPPRDYCCAACDGTGWTEGGDAMVLGERCSTCNGTGRVPNSFGLCGDCPPAAHKDATTRCAQCPRREEVHGVGSKCGIQHHHGLAGDDNWRCEKCGYSGKHDAHPNRCFADSRLKSGASSGITKVERSFDSVSGTSIEWPWVKVTFEANDYEARDRFAESVNPLGNKS